MNTTSPLLRASLGPSNTSPDGLWSRRWPRHVFFAFALGLAVYFSLTVVYPGTRISVAWPASGIAVWWAVTCRSRRSFIGVCVAVFAISALCLALVGRPYWTVLLVSSSLWIAGPLVALILIRAERRSPSWSRESDDGHRAPLARIESPRQVYQLALVALITVPIAKLLTVLSLMLNHADPNLMLYLNLVLRDVAGMLAIAGPGIALFTAGARTVSAAMLGEFAGAVAVTVVILVFVFWPWQGLPLVYLVMLPLYWSATRLPVVLALIHMVITVVGTLMLTYLLGPGPFGLLGSDSVQEASAIQLFIIACVMLSLVVSTTVQQHSAVVREYEAAAATIPDALLLVDREDTAMPVNEAAQGLVTHGSDGRLVTRGLRHVEGPLLDDDEMPDARALRGEDVRGMLVELDQPDAEDGERIYYSVRASPLIRDGELEPSHALLLFHDSTDEYENMRRLQTALDEARDLFEHAPQGVATLDEDGVIQQANRAFGELVGSDPSDLEGVRLDEFDADGDLAPQIRWVADDPGHVVQVDRRFTSRDGSSRRVALSLRTMAGDGEADGKLLLNAVDITERQRLHELVSQLADHDALTGLFNRRRFESELAAVLERSAREDSDGALLLVDLDYFKQVNDLLGHKKGDEVLVEVAHLLRLSTRSGDVVGRLGGDEFILVLPDADRTAAEAVGRRIVQSVREHFGGGVGALGRLTASVGVAMFSEARNQDVDPYVLADNLLYVAKHSGRNRFASAGSDTADGSTADETFSARVARILDREALRVEIQPIAEMETGRVVMGEALVRVATDEDPIPPGRLVEEIERAGLGPRLDVCVLRQAIALLPELQRVRPDFRLSVNVSAQSLVSTATARVALEELERHRVAPESLVIELTETAPVEDFDAARKAQKLLREHGVTLAIDDFGIGQDPYRCLKELDFGMLKIAGEFVAGMVDDPSDAMIVSSFVHLAGGLGMDVVAEYVADGRIHDAARSAGATHAQGFHLGRSLPVEEFIETYLLQIGVE